MVTVNKERFSRDQGRSYLTLRAERLDPDHCLDVLPSEETLLLGGRASLKAHAPGCFSSFLGEQRAIEATATASMRQALVSRAQRQLTMDESAWTELRRRERWVRIMDQRLQWYINMRRDEFASG